MQPITTLGLSDFIPFPSQICLPLGRIPGPCQAIYAEVLVLLREDCTFPVAIGQSDRSISSAPQQPRKSAQLATQRTNAETPALFFPLFDVCSRISLPQSAPSNAQRKKILGISDVFYATRVSKLRIGTVEGWGMAFTVLAFCCARRRTGMVLGMSRGSAACARPLGNHSNQMTAGTSRSFKRLISMSRNSPCVSFCLPDYPQEL